MRDYWLTQGLLSVAGFGFIALALLGLGLALWLPKKWWGKLLAVAAVGVLVSIPLRKADQETKQQQVQVDDYKARYTKAKALFDERCKTAGEKIYRTVENVESVLLLKPRPQMRQGFDEADQYWVGAALPKESTGNQYIMNFLFYDVPAEGQAIRFLSSGGTAGRYGTITAGVRPKGQKGYRFVETEEAGKRWRHSLKPLSEYSMAGDPLDAFGKLETATQPFAKYSVIYENISDQEGRAHWIAGARVRVTNLESGEVLGELTQYSFEAGFGSQAGFRQPWAFARTCQSEDSQRTSTGTVRYFVDKILKPIQEK